MDGPGPDPPAGRGARGASPPEKRRGIGPLDSVTLVALAAWAAVPLVYFLAEAWAHHQSLTGGEGLFPADQLQYLSWIRSSGAHLLAANGFDLAGGGHVFLHPMLLLSGWLWRAGLGLPIAYLAWLPVAVVTLFVGCRQFCRRMLGSGLAGSAALILAIFFASPTTALLSWTGASGAGGAGTIAGEVAPTGALWGYLPRAIAVGITPLVLLGLARLLEHREGPVQRRLVLATGLAGLAGSWLHPWQGETLLLVLAGAVIWARPRRARLAITVVAALTVAPLGYYLLLARTDAAWMLAQAQSPLDRPGVAALGFALLPLAAFAILGMRRPQGDVRERILLLWPAAALAGYFGLAASDPPHALEGLSLPLAVLAVRGWQRLGLPRGAAVGAVVIASVPGLAFATTLLAPEPDPAFGRNLLRADEARALRFVAQAPGSGGVLPSIAISSTVPASTGRRTWLGHAIWTPDFAGRARADADLFAGRLGPSETQALVRQVGAQLILADCDGHADLTPLLGDLLRRTQRFGCATVYELNISPKPGTL